LNRLGLTTLEARRQRGDLIEVYKILTGKENIEYGSFFQLASSEREMRGHELKLYHRRSRLDIRKFSFSQRVVKVWNKLPQHVIEAPTVNSFKNRLDGTNSSDMST
jgi:hypothetical protein